MQLPGCEEARRICLVSAAICVAIGVVLAYQRAGITDPQYVPIFRRLILFHDLHAVLPFLVILLVALFAPVRALGLRAAAWCGRNPWPLALGTAVLLALAAQLVYHARPLAMDEYAPLFQSRIFAAGEIAGRFPPALIDWLVPKDFQSLFIRVSHATGAVASLYWPGFALLLTPFTALGAPWLLNPLIGGATVLVLYLLGRELFQDRQSAGLVMLLALASPAVTINAISYYAMSAHLLANALFLLLVLRRTPLGALLAGVVGSIALVLHNPLPHMLFATPWLAWVALQPRGLRLLGILIAGYAPLCLVIGFGWRIFIQGFESAASVAAVSEIARPDSALRSFVSVLGVFSAPTSQVVEARLFALVKVWLWAAPALVTLAAIGAWRLRDQSGPWLALAGSALLTYFGYFFVDFDQGHGWGYRYFHGAWLALPLFAVAALRPSTSATQPPSTLPGFLAGCALLGLLLVGLRALQVESFVARHWAQLPQAPGEVRVVIVDPANAYYAADLVQNDPFLRGRVVTLVTRGRGADEAMMAKQFPQYRLLRRESRGSVWGTP